MHNMIMEDEGEDDDATLQFENMDGPNQLPDQAEVLGDRFGWPAPASQFVELSPSVRGRI
jgi:hypothetical protein